MIWNHIRGNIITIILIAGVAICSNAWSVENKFSSNHGNIIHIANMVTQKIVKTLIESIVTSFTRCLNPAPWLNHRMGCIHWTIPNIGIKKTINALLMIPYAAMARLHPYIHKRLLIKITTPLAATCLAKDGTQTRNISLNLEKWIL